MCGLWLEAGGAPAPRLATDLAVFQADSEKRVSTYELDERLLIPPKHLAFIEKRYPNLITWKAQIDYDRWVIGSHWQLFSNKALPICNDTLVCVNVCIRPGGSPEHTPWIRVKRWMAWKASESLHKSGIQLTGLVLCRYGQSAHARVFVCVYRDDGGFSTASHLAHIGSILLGTKFVLERPNLHWNAKEL